MERVVPPKEVMSGPSFFFTDEAFQPVTITRERQWKCHVPMAPPMYEVCIDTNLTRRSFRGSAMDPGEARRIAIEKLDRYMRRNAFVSTELTLWAKRSYQTQGKTNVYSLTSDPPQQVHDS